jgi:adenylate cyclase
MISTVVKSRLHIASGLVLALFIVGHFSNHALGIASLAAMEQGRAAFNVVWRSLPGTILLYGALATHVTLAFDALIRRRTLRMPPGEALKIGLGLLLPFLIGDHVIATRLELAVTGYERDYGEVLRAMGSSTGAVLVYSSALVVVWMHGCLGLWYWLRSRGWFRRAAPLFHMLAVILPLLALIGFYSGLRWAPTFPPLVQSATPMPLATLYDIRDAVYLSLLLAIAAVVLVKLVPRRRGISIRYPGGRVVAVDPGTSVLEASRTAGIPHVSVCGGRGRCSTCRIQILSGLEGQPEPESRERATLKSIAAGRDVRLACQLRPTADLTVLPLVEAGSDGERALRAPAAAAGQERLMAALFCDLRGFTRLSEQKLPYDVVFLLNRYFATVGEAVSAEGGVIDKFIGDGAIALFGLETDFPKACQQALGAAIRLGDGIAELNRVFRSELDAPLRIAMGLHGGTAIVGRMGFGDVSSVTAIGDTINTASRLEGLAKARDVELAVSARVLRAAGVTIPSLATEDIEIRGREALLETWFVPRVAVLAKALAAPARVPGEA